MSFAFVFPGQGSQSIGMFGNELYVNAIQETLKEASDIVGQDLIKLVDGGSPQEINKTVNTQIIMLSSGVAFFKSWKQAGGKDPTIMAGHSLGEYAALVSAGAITFVDSLKLVYKRATLMQEAVPVGTGAIAAIIGLQPEKIKNICNEISSEHRIVQAANYNSPIQTVIAGHKECVEKAMQMALSSGAKRTIVLPMSVPSHCDLLEPMLGEFEEALNQIEINLPQIPVLQNADSTTAENGNDVKTFLLKQIVNPVDWTQIINKVVKSYKVSKIIELGPGKILTGLNKRIVKSIEVIAAGSFSDLHKQVKQT